MKPLFNFFIAFVFLSQCIIAQNGTMSISPLPVDTTEQGKLKRDLYRASDERTNDLIHTKLEVSFDWKKCRMNGKATLELKPYFYPTKMLYLNAKGMAFNNLEVFEANPAPNLKFVMGKKLQSATYINNNDSLKINLGREFKAGDHYFVMIDYVARPNELAVPGGSDAISDDKGLYFINPSGDNPFKMQQIWTQGEVQSSSVWFPTIDSPNEKATQEIYMTVDKKYTTLSNGLLVDTKMDASGMKTDHWKLDQPHSPYLAMMAVGEFKKVVDAPWRGKEISYYVEKEYEPHAKAIFGDTKEMIEFFSNRLGVPYAWPKYSQIAVRDYVSGAMENTSSTLHGDFMVYQTTRETMDNKKGTGVIAHELFHQWFGDLVTTESWANLSLNESFATYGVYLWDEYKYGRDVADYNHWQSKQGYLNSKRDANLIRFDYKAKDDMFDGISYNKGGQILHMLRKAVGDEAFFASLKNYLETNRYKSAEAHHLRLAFEEVTGRDMNWFFNQWYFNKGRPVIKVTKKYNVEQKALELTVEQKQDLKTAPLYLLPLEIDIYSKGKVERKHIVLDGRTNQFVFNVNEEPELVNFDAERQLLCDLEYVKTKTEYIFQLKNAPLFEDRWEALHKLEDEIPDQNVYQQFLRAAKQDTLYAIRNYAISQLEGVPANYLPEVKKTLTEIYKTDKKSSTRVKALAALNSKFSTDQDVLALNELAFKEQSYAIIGEALQITAKTNTVLAMQKAKSLESEHSKDLIFTIGNLYATNGSDEQISFFHNSLKKLNGFELTGILSAYAKTVKRCSQSQSFLIFTKDLEDIGKGAPKFMNFACQRLVKDVLSFTEGKEKELKQKIEASKKENQNTSKLELEMQSMTQAKEALTKSSNNLK